MLLWKFSHCLDKKIALVKKEKWARGLSKTQSESNHFKKR